MVHIDIKHSEKDGSWLVITHGNFGKTVTARASKKQRAIDKAKGRITQMLLRGHSNGEVHIYSKRGELQRVEDVEHPDPESGSGDRDSSVSSRGGLVW